MFQQLAIGAVAVVVAVCANGAEYAKPELLIEADALQAADAAGKFVILDARPRAKFDAGHIPGARWVDHADWSSAFDAFAQTPPNDAATAAWSERIGKLGIDGNLPVVVYDDSLSKDAARIWWILQYWGVKDGKLLNGGWPGWTAAKFTEEKQTVTYPQAKFVAQPVTLLLATKELLLESLKTGSLQIVDVRSDGEFCGDEKLKNKRGGAIPGAKHLEWSDLLDKQTARFKPAAELKKLFQDANVDLSKPSVAHCQGGGRAAVMAFGMSLMGGPDVRNYYRSFGEWANADDTPLVPGKKK